MLSVSLLVQIYRLLGLLGMKKAYFFQAHFQVRLLSHFFASKFYFLSWSWFWTSFWGPLKIKRGLSGVHFAVSGRSKSSTPIALWAFFRFWAVSKRRQNFIKIWLNLRRVKKPKKQTWDSVAGPFWRNMASKRPPRGPQDGSKIDQKSIKNRWFYDVEKAGFCDPSHTLGPFYSAQKNTFFWTSIFHQFFICFALVFIFVLFKSSSWGHFFGDFFFFAAGRRLRAPTFFFWAVLGPPPGPSGPPKCAFSWRKNTIFTFLSMSFLTSIWDP